MFSDGITLAKLRLDGFVNGKFRNTVAVFFHQVKRYFDEFVP